MLAPRLANGCQDQPGFLHIRRQRGGKLRPAAGGMFIASIEGIGGLLQGLAGWNGLAVHGIIFQTILLVFYFAWQQTRNSISMVIAPGNFYGETRFI